MKNGHRKTQIWIKRYRIWKRNVDLLGAVKCEPTSLDLFILWFQIYRLIFPINSEFSAKCLLAEVVIFGFAMALLGKILWWACALSSLSVVIYGPIVHDPWPMGGISHHNTIPNEWSIRRSWLFNLGRCICFRPICCFDSASGIQSRIHSFFFSRKTFKYSVEHNHYFTRFTLFKTYRVSRSVFALILNLA